MVDCRAACSFGNATLFDIVSTRSISTHNHINQIHKMSLFDQPLLDVLHVLIGKVPPLNGTRCLPMTTDRFAFREGASSDRRRNFIDFEDMIYLY
jgi:hypothetical protein